MKSKKKEYRDKVLRAIRDYYDDLGNSHFITATYLDRLDFSSHMEKTAILRELSDVGFITIEKLSPDCCGVIRITDAGRRYLITEPYRIADEKRQRRHEWMLAIFSTLVGALASEPIWVLIKTVAEAFQKKP